MDIGIDKLAGAPVGAVIYPGARLRVEVIAAAIVFPDGFLRHEAAVGKHFIILTAKLRAAAAVAAVAGNGKLHFGRRGTRRSGSAHGVQVIFYRVAAAAKAKSPVPEVFDTRYRARRCAFNKRKPDIAGETARIVVVG